MGLLVVFLNPERKYYCYMYLNKIYKFEGYNDAFNQEEVVRVWSVHVGKMFYLPNIV